VTEHDRDVEAAHERVEATSAEAVAVALRHIAQHEPFVDAPTQVADRDLGQFQQIANTRLVEKGEMLKLAEKNLARFVNHLATHVVIYPQINAVRLSVLAHVALAIRLEPVLKCQPLWSAIAREDWEDAADALMMTRWPDKAREDGERRRVLELARMMRSGTEPSSWVH
jgi:hypothetical protein